MPLLISADDLAARSGHPSLVILDCSATVTRNGTEARAIAMDDAFAAGHIPGARYLDIARALSDAASPLRFTRPTPPILSASLARLGISAGSEIVLYSKERYWTATRAWWVLHNAGHRRVSILDGGWRAWEAAGHPIETGAAVPASPAASQVWSDRGLFCDRADVLAAIDDGETLLINALPPAQFAGTETNYARPGTIPGSVNVPAASLVDPATGLFLPADRLATRFADAGVTPSRPVITFCGGGVAAAAPAFALALLGHTRTRVYDASLQEWAADPELPLVVAQDDG